MTDDATGAVPDPAAGPLPAGAAAGPTAGAVGAPAEGVIRAARAAKADAALTLQRSVDLLWGEAEPGSRGPQPILSRRRIVETAVAIADRNGLAELSMRRLAAELEAGAMSLYRHVPGRQELVDLMVDHVCAEFATDAETADAETAGAGTDAAASWRERVEARCRTEWAFYHRHPWMLEVPRGRPLLGPNSLRTVEATLRSLDGLGLDGQEMLDVVTTLTAWMTGLARMSVEARRAPSRTGIGDDEWWAAQAPYVEKALWSGDYPLFAEALRVTDPGPPEDRRFELGLARMLDGIQALVDARAADR